MDIVREIFERYRPDTKKLKDYGFGLNKGVFSCRKKLSEENFEMTVSVDRNGFVAAKLMDLDLGEEYINIYSERHGAFAAKLREEFIMILEEIRDHCFEKELFFDAQTKRIVAYLQKQYRAKPEFISKTHPEDAIFCNRGKWFVSIMNVKGKSSVLTMRIANCWQSEAIRIRSCR